MKSLIKLCLFLSITILGNCQSCYSSFDAKYCYEPPYCCNAFGSCAKAQETCMYEAYETAYGQCKDKRSAYLCGTNTKCCDFFDDCASSFDDCRIYMKGHCQSSDQYQLKCENCCVMRSSGHYCGDEGECREIRIAGIIFLIILILYYGGIIFFCFYGCYLRVKVDQKMMQIVQETNSVPI